MISQPYPPRPGQRRWTLIVISPEGHYDEQDVWIDPEDFGDYHVPTKMRLVLQNFVGLIAERLIAKEEGDTMPLDS